jgi:hypothetical protein
MDLAEAILEVNRVALEGLSGPDTERAICVLLRAHLADSGAHMPQRLGPLTGEEKADVHKALEQATCQHEWVMSASGWQKCAICGAEKPSV